MNIEEILKSGGVVRFHSCPGIDKQTLAEHQWGVSLIVQYLSPNCRKEVILAALLHDAAELYTGDGPFTMKRESPLIKGALEELEQEWNSANGIGWIFGELTSAELRILKVADMLEGMLYCTKQIMQGHTDAKGPLEAWTMAIANMYGMEAPPEGVTKLLGSILEMLKAWGGHNVGK